MSNTKTITTTQKTNHYYFRALVALAALALVASLLVLSAAKPAHATKNFFVNSTGDEADFDLTDGRCDVEPPTSPLTRCTLRAAIQEANAQPQADAIFFNIPGTGVHTIRPSSPLPAITDPLTIDGYTQGAFTSDPADDARPNTLAKGTNAVLKIQLNGSNAGSAAPGLLIETSQSVIKGLVINCFNGAGIFVAVGPSNRIEGNFVGTDPSGTRALGNGSGGVQVEGLLGDEASSTFIGGTTPETHNLISGNGGGGVIFSNKGLGIDLGNDGPTPNDPDDPATPEPDPDSDTGPNTLLNKPVLSSAKTVSGKTTIKGRLTSQPNKNFLVQFFSNPSGNEGKKFIGLTIASTDGSGKGSYTFSPKKAVAVGKTITATAADSSNNTSEFSAPRKVVAA